MTQKSFHARATRGRTSLAGESAAPPLRSQLAHATTVLGEVLSFAQPADAVLSNYFRVNGKLGHRDRGFIAESVYAVLRRLRWLQRLAGERATARQLLLAWLARGEGWSLRQFEGAINASERSFIEDVKAVALDAGTLAEDVDLPDWLVERLGTTLDEASIRALAQALNRPAPLDLRVNVLKTTREALLAALAGSGIAAQACPYSPQGVRLAGKPALQRDPRFLAGEFEVQDEGSQLLGFLVQPRRGELVVDFCAGAGGKTLQLGALMRSTGRLYAFDVADKRLARMRPRAARAGLSNLHPVHIDHERDARAMKFAHKADRVLVDAPCSGLGTLRRNPDLKWRQSPESVAEMVQRQGAILAAAARLVRPGGRLVYATCSLLHEENEGVVEAFLAAQPEFVLRDAREVLMAQKIGLPPGEEGDAYFRLWPHVHHTDGFFAAVLERAQ